ncbi:hypothetical protein HPB48_015906 [Haemaphysalis longicornis]|uniref:VWFD domain-containing protein n=1 Tax=Haemaphysalis longicornis TaxID=44386 RepID=A0A9J6GCC7_HAELO|nr:hypothetical protein HPB48_015906 [Haemaphysalis longicornis]
MRALGSSAVKRQEPAVAFCSGRRLVDARLRKVHLQPGSDRVLSAELPPGHLQTGDSAGDSPFSRVQCTTHAYLFLPGRGDIQETFSMLPVLYKSDFGKEAYGRRIDGEFVSEPPKCVLRGNRTLTTFDGLSFTLSPKREYTMFEDCHHGNFYGYVSAVGRKVTVRVYIHCLTASLSASGQAEVDGRGVRLPHREGSIVNIEHSDQGAVELRTHHGVVVRVHGNGTVVTSLAEGYAGRVCGLCGNANGDVRDDLNTKHHVSAKGDEVGAVIVYGEMRA